MALRDGSTVHVRPVRAGDEEAMLRFLEGLDPGSRMFRFASGGIDLEAAARLMVDVDYSQRYGLVAVRGASDDVVGARELFRNRARAGGGRVRDRRRAPGARPGDDPARPPGRGRRGARNHDLRGRGAAGEPPDDRGVPRERLPGRDVVAARDRSTSSCRPRSRTRRSSASRTETGSPRRPRSPASSSRGRSPSSGPRGSAERSAARSSTTCSRRASRVPSTPSIPRPTSSSRCGPTRASPRSRTRSTSR